MPVKAGGEGRSPRRAIPAATGTPTAVMSLTGTTTLIGSRKSFWTGLYSAAGARRTSQQLQRTRPRTPSGR